MTNDNKYTFNLIADACEMGMIYNDDTKTIRVEHDDTEFPFTVVINVAETVDQEYENKLYEFTKSKITINIEAELLPTY